jgi:hypothetical protein
MVNALMLIGQIQNPAKAIAPVFLLLLYEYTPHLVSQVIVDQQPSFVMRVFVFSRFDHTRVQLHQRPQGLHVQRLQQLPRLM